MSERIHRIVYGAAIAETGTFRTSEKQQQKHSKHVGKQNENPTG